MSKCEECLHNKVCHLREVCTEEETLELDKDGCEDFLCAVDNISPHPRDFSHELGEKA